MEREREREREKAREEWIFKPAETIEDTRL
jgi:hypothetical protein